MALTESLHNEASGTSGASSILGHWAVCSAFAIAVALAVAPSASGRLAGPSDSCLYYGLARSLVAGRGYSFNGGPHTVVPPLYPGLLAAILKTGTEAFLPMNLLSVAAAAVAVGAAWRLVQELTGDPRLGAACAGLFASTQLFFAHATLVLSDMVYTALSLVALAAAVHWRREERAVSPTALLCMLCTAAAYLTRAVGVALVLSIGLGLLIRRRQNVPWRAAFKRASLYGLVLAIPLGVWHGRNLLVSKPGGQGYVQATFSRLRRPEGSDRDTVPLSARQAASRILFWKPPRLMSALGATMSNRPTRGYGSMYLALGALTVLCMLLGLRRGYTIPAGYCIIYGGILLIAAEPNVDRYWLPLLPMAFCWLLVVVRDVGTWLARRRWTKVVGPVLSSLGGVAAAFVLTHKSSQPVILRWSYAGLAVLGGCGAVIATGFALWTMSESKRSAYLRRAYLIAALLLIGWDLLFMYSSVRKGSFVVPRLADSYTLAAEWLRAHTRPDALVMAQSRWVGALADRRYVGTPATRNQEAVIERIRESNVDWIVVDTLQVDPIIGADRADYLLPVLERLGDSFHIRTNCSGILIYEVDLPR